MKDEIAVILSIIVSFVTACIPYFLDYLILPYAIITFLLVLIVSTNLYFMLNFTRRMGKVEKATERESLVLNVLISGLIKVQKLSRSKRITVTEFLNEFSEAVEGVFKTIKDDYFSIPHSNPGPRQEQRKQELLEQARLKRISWQDGQELQRLLEEQKRQHEARGEVGQAILAGLFILFLAGVLVALFGTGED